MTTTEERMVEPVRRIYVTVGSEGFLMGGVFDDREVAELHAGPGERVVAYVRPKMRRRTRKK